MIGGATFYQHIEQRVAGVENPSQHRLFAQVSNTVLRDATETERKMINEAPVEFLRHRHVIASRPSLDVDNRDGRGRTGEGRCKGGVCVPKDADARRSQLGYDIAYAS